MSHIKSPINNYYDKQLKHRDALLTPAPGKVESIEDDWQNRFAGITVIYKSDDTIDDSEYLKTYDYYEKYSETKRYSSRKYYYSYINKIKQYHNFIIKVMTETSETWYVAAVDLPNKLEELEPFCTCNKCSMSKLNPLRYMLCDHCCNCIKSGYGTASIKYIEKAKQLLSESETLSNTKQDIHTYFKLIDWVMVSEVIGVSSIGYIMFKTLF